MLMLELIHNELILPCNVFSGDANFIMTASSSAKFSSAIGDPCFN